MFLVVLYYFNFFIVVLACFGVFFNVAYGLTKNNGFDGKPENIHIFSDQLIVDVISNNAEFFGEVRLVHKAFTLKSDQLKIIYCIDDISNESASSVIQEIIADGGVKITVGEKIVIGDHAVYLASKGQIVLTGPNTSINYDTNKVTGEKIIYFIKDERFDVEGSSGVKANSSVLLSSPDFLSNFQK